MSQWTKADVERIHARQAVPAKRGKYGATKTTVDGITFDSKREAARYSQLKLMQQAGEICGLTLQPKFPLLVNGVKIGEYRADFSYSAGPRSGAKGRAGVEDVKGFKTAMYRWKKKHVEAQYGIQIQEIA